MKKYHKVRNDGMTKIKICENCRYFYEQYEGSGVCGYDSEQHDSDDVCKSFWGENDDEI